MNFWNKQFLGFVLLMVVSNSLLSQNKPQRDTLFSTYYYQKASQFANLPQSKGDIIFLGNSITDGGEWSELFHDLRIKNRGISGDITDGVLNRLDEVIKRKPAKVFLLIGINDLARGVQADDVLENIFHIADRLHQALPGTQLYVQSLLPVNPVFGSFENHTNKSTVINQMNTTLKEQAKSHHYSYIDLNSSFKNSDGLLKENLTNDGLHLTGDGYFLWKHIIFPYVYDLELKPALIPTPKELTWKDGFFPLYQCKTIVANNPALQKEAKRLQDELQKMGYEVNIKNAAAEKDFYIELKLSTQMTDDKEGYQLDVNADKIVITGGNAHAVFNGLQTLLQLCRNGVTVDLCNIKDEPAFPWRAYMIDVGRNFVSVDLLKQQIDQMSRYKFNVFHFHGTEDIAWRIASKQYPQLTAPEYMLRNKGMYYTEQDLKELIAYCKERHITFIPEIDMPGHSAAFKRAMGTDMQSDTGMQYLKNILKEFCETYDVPFIHIGADEVKITNEQFVPVITRYIESLGKKVIGWQPGGNFTTSTWRQLWMDDLGHAVEGKNILYIDSRHLYINHMDPLEAVVTIFNRKIGDKNEADKSLQGATLCMWHDRAVRDERDILTMNPVYPAMLAFAERTWVGGGVEGWIANIDQGNKDAFIAFENKLLDHKKIFFKGKPFPYVRQSHLKWNLIGPYDNKGNTEQKFAPEIKGVTTAPIAQTATGGTIIIRHWWAPKIKGAIDQPNENTTWYASTQIWAEEAGEKNFWIGFNNLSRSPATDGPPAGAWDQKGSKLWVNDKLVGAPLWNRPGQKGNSEIPLVDEGYEYRQPTRIVLKQGWNKVLVKAPIASFKGKDWQNPVKWMFTFVETDDSLN